jgi:hypothetical protein
MRSFEDVRTLTVAALMLSISMSSACLVDEPSDGMLGCNEVVLTCGCWGPRDPLPRPSSRCESGFAVPRLCPGYCAAGGSPYATVCTCDPGTTVPRDAGTTVPRDAGTIVPRDAGTTVPRDAGTTVPRDAGRRCLGTRELRSVPAILGNVQTLGLPAFACGAPTALTASIVGDINTFWRSQMTPCACDLPGCPFNAWVQPQTPGFVYYRRDFLQWVSQAGGGGAIGAAWMLSHEAGHNLQFAWGFRYSSMKAQELGADCLSGVLPRLVGVLRAFEHGRRDGRDGLDLCGRRSSAVGLVRPQHAWHLQRAYFRCASGRGRLPRGSGAGVGLCVLSLGHGRNAGRCRVG